VTPNTLLWFTIAGLVFTGFVAVGANSLRRFSRHDLQAICRKHDALEKFGSILRGHERVALGIENLLSVCVALTITVGAWLGIKEWSQMSWPELALTVAVSGLVLAAVVVWIPSAVARLWAEPLLYQSWRLWRTLSVAMAPLVYSARAVDAVLHRLAGRTPEVPSEESIEEEIRTIVNEGHREGLLEEDAREMIEGIIELGDADVSQIMTPRTDMHMIHVGVSWEGMLDEVMKTGHTRIPVFDKNRDDIVGILHGKDLLPELAKGPGSARRPWFEILRKPYFVPETKKVDDVLQEFQQTRNHLAVVLDEYGGVSGLVTIEDVLEEIVGEIVDEYDEDLVEEIEKIDDRTCEALGRAHIDEINDALSINLPEDGDYDTIGGFVFSELGHVPQPEDSLVWQELVRITVLEATRRRIDRVRLEVIGEAARESA